MIDDINYRTVDMMLFIIANLVNLLIVGIFLARSRGLAQIESILGLVMVATALPVAAAIVLNISWNREWWTIALPAPLIVFCGMELVLDYIMRLDFRNTALLWPYIFVFYLASLGMIGYCFSIGKPHGFITLFTYFLNLLATWYAHSN